MLCRINRVLEHKIKRTKRTNTKGKNFLEQHPPKEVGLRPQLNEIKNEILEKICKNSLFHPYLLREILIILLKMTFFLISREKFYEIYD